MGAASSCKCYHRGCFQDGHHLLSWRGRGRGSEVPKGPDEEAATGALARPWPCVQGDVLEGSAKGRGGWRL